MSKKQNPSDRILIQQYLEGDSSTLPILVKRYHKSFCERVYWITKDKDAAKDIAQECWVIIIKKLSQLENLDSFKSWAMRIVYTKAIDGIKKSKREREKLDAFSRKGEVGVDTEEENKSKQKILLKAIQKLPKQKQDIIRLFYTEEYSIAEISAFLNIPIGTVKSRLFKAREKLKSELKNKL